MAFAQEGGSRVAEVAHLVVVAKELLQLHRVGVLFSVADAHSVGHAIAHTGYADFLCDNLLTAEKEQCEEDVFHAHGQSSYVLFVKNLIRGELLLH
jgi:hypothetical protein